MVSIPGTGPTGALDELSRQFAAVFDSDPGLGQRTEAARRVLAVSASLFYLRGSAATSVRELTGACGLTPGALYNHFGSRDELLFALVDAGHAAAQRDLDAALAAAAADPRSRFIAFVRAYTELHLRFPPFAQLIHREYVHLAEERRAVIVARRRRMRDQLTEILYAGVRARMFDLVGGPDAETGSAMMVLDMCSRTSEWFNPDQPSERFVDRYTAAALRLVGASGTA